MRVWGAEGAGFAFLTLETDVGLILMISQGPCVRISRVRSWRWNQGGQEGGGRAALCMERKGWGGRRPKPRSGSCREVVSAPPGWI